MNRLPYLWVALLLLCISACTRTEQSVAPEADQDLPPAVSPSSPTDPPPPPAASTKLIECPDCGNMVSKRAKHCVKCGAPIAGDLKEPAYSAPPPPAVAPFDSGQAKTLQKVWANHLGVPVQITDSVGMKFNLIPPGEFLMGSPESEADRYDNETQHRVEITKPFYLSVHEVTQQQYEKVMGTNPSSYKGDTKPVEMVSWHDAVAFFRKLSAQEGVEYRLPTEAEWEYACRAGTTTVYSFGDDDSPLGEYAWHMGNSEHTTHPVGEKKPNAWGLFDMHGNVYEWCQDLYGPYKRLQVVSDPIGPASGDHGRVLRGGAFLARPRNVRAADRSVNVDRPVSRFLSFVGFRLARTYPLSP